MEHANRWRNDINRFPAGMKSGSKVWFVDSVLGASGNTGNRPEIPFSSLVTAVGVASAYDYIFVMPGHVEALTTAGQLTIATAGLTIEFIADGTAQGSINFNAAAATMVITGANTILINPNFIAGIDAVAAAINVQAADFQMLDAQYFDATSKATTIQVLTTVAAQRMIINGYKYFAGSGGTQKTDGIKCVGVLDQVVLKNIDITGDFTESPVSLTSNCTNLVLEKLNLNNLNSSPNPALTLSAGITGFAQDVKLRIASGTTYTSSAAAMQWGTDCLGYAAGGTGGAALGSATDISGAVNSVGVQTSTVQSKTDSVGTNVSTLLSQATSIGTGVSTAISAIQSLTTVDSTSASYAYSVGQQATLISTATSTITSMGTSIGTGGSTIISQASSIATGVVSVGTNTSTHISQGTSIGLGVSQHLSQGTSIGLGVSTALSGISSTGIAVSTVNSKSDSVGTGVSTAISLATASYGNNIKQNKVNLANTDMTSTVTRFTVANGPILVRHLGFFVTTAVAAGANTMKFSFTPTSGSATDLCAATDTASAGISQLFSVNGVKATALVKTTDVGITRSADENGMPIILGTGVLQTIFSAGAPGTGAGTLFVEWEPLVLGATVS